MMRSGFPLRRQLQPRLSPFGDPDLVALDLQVVLEAVRQIDVVFHKQNAGNGIDPSHLWEPPHP